MRAGYPDQQRYEQRRDPLFQRIEFTAFQTMEIILIPPTPFVNGSTVTIQLQARDLLENLLEADYQFYIGSVTPPSGTGGFGTSGFGTSPFGGA